VKTRSAERRLEKTVWPANKAIKRFLFVLTAASAALVSGCGEQITVLNPQGPVAKSEANLIWLAIGVMSIVMIVVFGIFGYVLIKYRANRKDQSDYDPENHGNRKLEIIWTLIPILMVTAIAIPTVRTTYQLKEPPAAVNKDPITIDVTSANWKWIFKYPGQGIETVNYVNIPAGTPVNFRLTSVGPMNSFWVPALGGQEYSMPGMEMTIWLEASHPGTYLGRSANFSGKGFVHMSFNVVAMDATSFDGWVKQVKAQYPPLTKAKYEELLKPGVVNPMTFSSTDSANPDQMSGMPGMGGA